MNRLAWDEPRKLYLYRLTYRDWLYCVSVQCAWTICLDADGLCMCIFLCASSCTTDSVAVSIIHITKNNLFVTNMEHTNHTENWRRSIDQLADWCTYRVAQLEKHFGSTVEESCSSLELMNQVHNLIHCTRQFGKYIGDSAVPSREIRRQLGDCVRTAVTLFSLRANDSPYFADHNTVMLGTHAAMQVIRSFRTNPAPDTPGAVLPQLSVEARSLLDYFVGKSGRIEDIFEAVYYGLVEVQASAARKISARERHMSKLVGCVKLLRNRFQENGEISKWPQYMDVGTAEPGHEGYFLSRFWRQVDFSTMTICDMAYNVLYFCHAVADLCMCDEFDEIMKFVTIPSVLVNSKLPKKYKRVVKADIYLPLNWVAETSHQTDVPMGDAMTQCVNQEVSVAQSASHVGFGNTIVSSTVPYVACNPAACVMIPASSEVTYSRQNANVTTVVHEKVAPSAAHEPIVPPPVDRYAHSNIEICPSPQENMETTDDVKELVDDLISAGFDWNIANPSEINFDPAALENFFE